MAHPFFTEYQVSLISRYVAPPAEEPRRYLELLHGNFTRLPKPEQSAVFESLADDARAITDADLLSLLETGWRGRLVVGWLIGLDQRTQFRERLGELLLESRMPFACQGYCFALARFGTSADAALLTAYLDRWLRRPECRYDQDWALGALQQIDTLNGSALAEQFLAPQGLWHQWASVDAERCNQRVEHFHALYRAAVAHA